MTDKQPTTSVDSDHLAALSAAIRVGIDDIESGRHQDVDDPGLWVDEIAKAVTTQSVA